MHIATNGTALNISAGGVDIVGRMALNIAAGGVDVLHVALYLNIARLGTQTVYIAVNLDAHNILWLVLAADCVPINSLAVNVPLAVTLFDTVSPQCETLVATANRHLCIVGDEEALVVAVGVADLHPTLAEPARLCAADILQHLAMLGLLFNVVL